MSVKITNLTALNVRALDQCLTEQEKAKVTLGKTIAVFEMSKADAVTLVITVRNRQGSRTGHPYQSLHAVLRKVQAFEPTEKATPEPAPAKSKGPKALRDLLRLDG